MREINTAQITETIAKLCIDACCELPHDLYHLYLDAYDAETSELGQFTLNQIIENAAIAKHERIPSCQDTGLTVVFVEIGQEVSIVGGDFEEAINAGIAKGYTEGYLRKSCVTEPVFNRINSNDNTPGIIHTKIVAGDKIKIRLAPKGAGSENKSAIKMLLPADGLEGIKNFVIETIKKADSDPCPPLVVGIGIGGTMEKAAILSKEAAMRDVSIKNPHPEYLKLEQELCAEINKLGIGPAGLGGKCTCLKVNIEHYATHIGCLPVAVNINCHAARHAHATI